MTSKTLEIIIKAKDQTGGAISGITGNLQSIGKVALGAAAGGVAALGAGIAAMATDGIRAAATMEEQISGIAAVMGVTADEVGPLKNLITDLGLDPNLKVTAEEAADSIEMLARNGLSMAEIMDGAAHSTVLLANATGGEFGQAADIMTDSMSLFGIEAGNASEAVDGITSVVTNSKFSIEDYALALAQGGGVAAATGVEFADFNTAISAMSPLFASGSDAGTSFKTMLQRLVPASNAASDTMQSLGLITENADGELKNMFFDSSGNMKDMADIAGLLERSMAGLSEEQRNEALSTMFGADAMRAAVGLMETGEEGFREMATAMGETDALASAQTRMDNLSGAFEIFQGVIDTAKLKLGDLFIPVLRELVEGLTVVLDGVMTFADAFQQGMVANLADGMSVWDAAVDSLLNWTQVGERHFATILSTVEALEAFSKKVMEVVQPIAAFISENVKLQDVLIVLGGAIAAVVIPAIASIMLAAAPVIAAFALAVGVVALLRQAWETDFAGIRDFVGGIWLSIQIAWEAFRALFEGDWETFLSLIKVAWRTAWRNIVEFLGNIWAEIKPKLTGLWTSIQTWFNGIDWGSLGRAIVDGIKNGISNAAQGLLDAIGGLASDAWNTFKSKLGISSPSKAFAMLGESMGQGLVVGLQAQRQNVAMASAGMAGAAMAGATNSRTVNIGAVNITNRTNNNRAAAARVMEEIGGLN